MAISYSGQTKSAYSKGRIIANDEKFYPEDPASSSIANEGHPIFILNESETIHLGLSGKEINPKGNYLRLSGSLI